MTQQEPLLDALLRRPEPKAGLVVGVVVAVVVHLAVIPGSAVLPVRPVGERSGFHAANLSLTAASKAQQRIEFTMESSSSTKVAVEKPVEEDPKGQVVSLPAKKEEKPLAADYLAETDQRAERETRARVTGITEHHTRAPSEGSKQQIPTTGDASSSTKMLVTGPQRVGGPQGDGGSTSGDATMWDSVNPGGGPPRLALEIPRIKKTKALDLPETDDGDLRQQRDHSGLEGNSTRLRLTMGKLLADPNDVGQGEGEGGVGRAGGSGDDGLPGRISVPTVAQIEQMAGLPANDHLLLEEDDATSLNAFQWKHATYFNRVADAIRRVWAGGEVLGRSDPDGRIFGFEDRLTMLEVTVDNDGNVVDVMVKVSSGAGPLDDEAMRSVRAAGPFPHPPGVLFKGRDRFSFSFGFAVNYNRSSLDLNWRPY